MFKAQETLQPAYLDQPLAELWQQISPLYAVDEASLLRSLLPLATPSDDQLVKTTASASELIKRVRADKNAIHMIDALLLEYSLDSKEGILLMCLAEALMRIPDTETADALIRDKLSVADWKSHLKNSDSLLVNASTWGLLLTGKVVTLSEKEDSKPAKIISRLVNKMSEPIIRQAMNQAMKIMGQQFVLGSSIDNAFKNGKKSREAGYTYSFDMLGEAALTSQDADKYYQEYLNAIERVGNDDFKGDAPVPSVSIKLSALHPRYEEGQKHRVKAEMATTVLNLLRRARELDVAITIDAEEADRLELSLELFELLYRDPAIQGWGKLGLVIQAYSKRALPVLAWLAALAKQQGDTIPLRLVKGAYWDSELKLSQQRGFSGYPVFTRKEGTDVSYLACARFLLSKHIEGLIYPQFASHNAHTVAAILNISGHTNYEFQRLHGMGYALYDSVKALNKVDVRIYAPVGAHKDLLPYLVRRLLENGANSSFVHRLVDARCPVEDLVEHPADTLRKRKTLHNHLIPLPKEIYGSSRDNSSGINIDIHSQWTPFQQDVNRFKEKVWQFGPIINGQTLPGDIQTVTAPYDRNELVGNIDWADEAMAEQALNLAYETYPQWNNTPVSERDACLNKLADLLEEHRAELVALCQREAGKTIHDSIDEIREAVDFCRYYAVQAESVFTAKQKAFNGEQLVRSGHGVFVCISPWNFPLAIFLGQITAALAAGNTVIAKPAEQTGLIACRAVELMLEAGFPAGVIQLLPGQGAKLGPLLTRDERVAGVAFTGSTPTAQRINRTLAERDGDIAPFIAETGGQNTMIVDSTSLPEQVARDVVNSAFVSAGQRCSALRVLYVQQDVAERIIHLIKGTMAELSVGRPELHSTDVGPVIDANAKDQLLSHIEGLKSKATLLAQVKLDDSCDAGYFVPPTALEINDISQLSKENFGPILHLIRFKAGELDQVIDKINQTGFGLTMGVHSRNESTCAHIEQRARVGNCYINRDQIGAVVGVQPFGGQGLSGTGPKAGGPRYLLRFSKQTFTGAQ